MAVQQLSSFIGVHLADPMRDPPRGVEVRENRANVAADARARQRLSEAVEGVRRLAGVEEE